MDTAGPGRPYPLITLYPKAAFTNQDARVKEGRGGDKR